jgi:hypothetical protein
MDNDQAVLTAIGLIDGKVKDVQTSVQNTSDKLSRIEYQQTQQTTVLNTTDERIRNLELNRIQENRVCAIESRLISVEGKVTELEKSDGKNTTILERISKDVTEQKDALKPIAVFVNNMRFILPLITGLGGILGAILTALILKAVRL